MSSANLSFATQWSLPISRSWKDSVFPYSMHSLSAFPPSLPIEVVCRRLQEKERCSLIQKIRRQSHQDSSNSSRMKRFEKSSSKRERGRRRGLHGLGRWIC